MSSDNDIVKEDPHALKNSLRNAASSGLNLQALTIAAALSAICALNSAALGWGTLQSWAFMIAAGALLGLRFILGRRYEPTERTKPLLSQAAMILPALSVLLVLSVSRELSGLHLVLATLTLLCAFLRTRDLVHVALAVLILYPFVQFEGSMASYWSALALGILLASSLRFGYDLASQRSSNQSGTLERLSEDVENLHVYFSTHFEKAVRQSGGCVLTTSPDGLILRVDRDFDELTGCSRADVSNQPLEAVMAPEDQETVMQALSQVRRRESVVLHAAFSTVDQVSPELELTFIPVVTGSEVREITLIVRDPAKQNQLRDELEDSRRRFEMAARGTNDGIWEWDVRRNSLYYSPRWKAMLGYEEDEIGDRLDEWIERVHPDDRKQLKISLTSLVQGSSERLSAEYRIKHRNGNYLWVRCSGLVETQESSPVRIIGSQTDITSFKVTEEQLLHDAFHDPLTGLSNRAQFEERLTRALDRSKRNRTFSFAVLFLDLDKLKMVNDTFGHDAGDRLLGETARRLQSCVGPGDLVARVGGDEFTILCERVRDAQTASRIAERIHSRLRRPFQSSEQQIEVSASIGVALSSTGYERTQDILRDADAAMYRAKLGGGGKFQIFDDEMRARSLEQHKLENDLHLAKERGEFTVYYQPIVQLDTSEIVGLESLIRWRHPHKGLLVPKDFWALARECGLAIDLNWWVLEEACRQIGIWNQLIPLPEQLWVSVNVELPLLDQPDLIQKIQSLLAKTGVDSSFLKLELPEVQNRAHQNSRALTQLHEAGISLQLDDFGTGSFSLDYLHKLPIESLKINRALVERLEDETAINLVDAMVRLSHSLEVKVIAEGITSASNAAILRNLKCQYGQGNLYSQPLSRAATERLLVNLYGYRSRATQQSLLAVV